MKILKNIRAQREAKRGAAWQEILKALRGQGDAQSQSEAISNGLSLLSINESDVEKWAIAISDGAQLQKASTDKAQFIDYLAAEASLIAFCHNKFIDDQIDRLNLDHVGDGEFDQLRWFKSELNRASDQLEGGMAAVIEFPFLFIDNAPAPGAAAEKQWYKAESQRLQRPEEQPAPGWPGSRSQYQNAIDKQLQRVNDLG